MARTVVLLHNPPKSHGANKMSKKHARRNPDAAPAAGGLGREAVQTGLKSVLGVAAVLTSAYGLSKVAPTTLSSDAKALVLGVGSVGVGVGLHAKNMAPRVGKAILAGGLTLATGQLLANHGVYAQVDSMLGITATATPTTPSGIYYGTDGYAYASPQARQLPAGYSVVENPVGAPAGYAVVENLAR